MANHLMALVNDKRVEALCHMLQRSGIVHREPRPHNGEKQNQQHEYQQLHGYVIGDWGLRVRGLNVNDAENGVGYASQVFI
jgi:hypothetical protein